MSGDLELLGGGAVAVDTETLRRTAAGFVGARDDLERISHRFGSLQNMLFAQRGFGWNAASAASVFTTRLAETMARAERIAASLREAAAVYELVEVNAEYRVACFSGDADAMRALSARRDAILDDSPDAMEKAVGLEFDRAIMWPSELVRQATEIGRSTGEDVNEEGAIYGGAAMGFAAIGLAAVTGLGGTGLVGRGARLTGEPEPVRIGVLSRTGSGAPATLAAAAARIPNGERTRVRVEKYTMPDGSRQFVVYIAGMRSGLFGGVEPNDDESNVQLYRGERSSSYIATEQALVAAGAETGDVVHAFGHSQGAMIAAHLALEGPYDVQTLVTFGSPIEADVGPETLSVGVRHTDDPVAALAGGGNVRPVGAPGSFVAERSADPSATVKDFQLPAHRMPAYIETAALIDASSDPRVDAVRSVFDELKGAASVVATDYSAERITSSSADAG